MELDQSTLARARLAVWQAMRGFLFDPNVSLIDFGFPERGGQIREDQLTVRIHVHHKMSGLRLESAVDTGLTRSIPAEIGGFPTDVPEGTYLPGQGAGWWNGPTQVNRRAGRMAPLCGGVSISSERQNGYGTLGGWARDRQTGKDMILSNWHVLAGDWWASPGQRIYQPGRLDGGGPLDTVATLTRHAMSANLDAAAATLTGDRPLSNDQFDLGPVRGVVQPSLGMPVIKSGRRSEITRGRVTAIEGSAVMNYAGIDRIIRHITTIEPYYNFEQVSSPGDSGSWWLEESTRRAAGLHFAGSDAPMERALALDMTCVVEALQVDLATETPARLWPAAYQRAGG